MTALNHKMWKPKYLFHDWEKPWLRLLMPYEKVQKWHRHHHRHHLEWLEDHIIKCIEKDGNIRPALDRFDWEAMMIDWECSRFTKEASTLNARDELAIMGTLGRLSKYPDLINCWEFVKERSLEVLNRYGFEQRKEA